MVRKYLKYTYELIPFKKEIFSLLKNFINLPHCIYKHLHFKGVFQVKLEDKYFKINHHGYFLENELFWKGIAEGYEKNSIRLWIELSKKSEIIFDIGANTGIFSLIAKTVKPNSKVYGFEPVERVFLKYIDNCKLNNYSDINAENAALSNKDGDTIVYDSPSEHVYTIVFAESLPRPTWRETVETRIKTIKLSTFIKEKALTKIDLIKMDVDRHEADVLMGMEEFLDLFRPTMIIEILEDKYGKKAENILKNKEYLFFNIGEEKLPERVEHLTGTSESGNFLICSEKIACELNL